MKGAYGLAFAAVPRPDVVGVADDHPRVLHPGALLDALDEPLYQPVSGNVFVPYEEVPVVAGDHTRVEVDPGEVELAAEVVGEVEGLGGEALVGG